MRERLKITSKDVFLSITSIGFDISGLELYLPILSGSKLIIADNEESRDPFKLIELVKQYKVTVLQATPTMWKMLLDAGWQHDGSIKVLCGGESLSKDLAERLLAKGYGFWHCYGPTETTIWSTVNYVDQVDDVKTWVPFGKPVWNTFITILDTSKF